MDYFAKKQWIRIAVCAVLVAAAVLAMTGVFSGNQPVTYDPAAKNLPAGATTAEATEQGFGGEVTVSVALDGSTVRELTIDTPNETESLGKRASTEEFIGQFIGKSGPFTFGEDGIEALSGATITSNAALKAINRAAGAEEAPAAEPEQAEETAPETDNKPAAEETKAETAASNGQVYGVYRVTKENNFSKVTVTASAKNGQLTDVQITSEGEGNNDLLTDEIRTAWAKAILESGSAAPDAITGATLKFSAASVQEAMTEILAEMNGEAAGTPAEPAAETEEKPTEEAKQEEAPAAQEETKAETAASDGQVYGVYRVTKENNFSKVTVTASAKNGALTDVQITSEGEEGMDLLTDEIRSEWAKAILESGSATPDAITGATLKFSAGSVQEAMTEILDQMTGKEQATAADEPATEEPDDKTPADESAETAGEPAGNGDDLLSLIAVSMGKEQENSYVTDYLEQDPYLVNIYEGYGFAKDYGSARGHYYTLTDVEKTQRPHAKANCLTCKTPDMHKMIEEQGVSVYSMPFDEVMAQMTQPISCYTCHGADDGNGGKLVVTHQYVNEALGENVSGIKAASLSCGQCHIEYYFTPSDKETMMPYDSVEAMTPEAILAYYDSMVMPDGTVGFYDWVQESTGTHMLKAQHPEMETFLYGRHAAEGMNCADCHMSIEMAEDGTVYHSHYLASPLDDPNLLLTCAECHEDTDMTDFVHRLQDKITARETEVGNRLSDFKDALAAAVSEGAASEEELDAVRKLYREAQWYFDFCYVENSEGAHNSELSGRCLDLAEERIAEGMELLGKE